MSDKDTKTALIQVISGLFCILVASVLLYRISSSDSPVSDDSSSEVRASSVRGSKNAERHSTGQGSDIVPETPVPNVETVIDKALEMGGEGATSLRELSTRVGAKGVNGVGAKVDKSSEVSNLHPDLANKLIWARADRLSARNKASTDSHYTQDYIVEDATGKSKSQPFEGIIEDIERKNPKKETLKHSQLVVGLLKKLASRSQAEHLAAGKVLLETVTEEDLPLLLSELKRGHRADVQLFLIRSIARVGNPSALNALLFEYKYGDKSLRPELLTAFGYLRSERIVPVLTRVAEHTGLSRNMRVRAIISLGRIPSSTARLALSIIKTKVAGEFSSAVEQAEAIQAGKLDFNTVDTDFPAGHGMRRIYKGTHYFFYHPAKRSKNIRPRLLVCVHGDDLLVNDLFKACLKRGKREGFAVLAPVFDHIQFPDYGRFNLLGVRADKRLLDIIELLGAKAGVETRQMFFFGMDHGADFVLRFILAYPERIGRAALFQAQFIDLENKRLLFPDGIGHSPLAPDIRLHPEEFVRSDILIMGKSGDAINADASSFLRHMKRYVISHGISPRVETMLNVREASVSIVWRLASKYLFDKAPKIKI